MQYKEYSLSPKERVEMGKRLETLIRQSGFKKFEFAELIGISRSLLSLYITGKRQPGDAIIEKMSILLNTHASFLLFGFTNMPMLDASALKRKNAIKTVTASNMFWNHLSPAEKVYVFATNASGINFLRQQSPGGITFDSLGQLLSGGIPDDLFITGTDD